MSERINEQKPSIKAQSNGPGLVVILAWLAILCPIIRPEELPGEGTVEGGCHLLFVPTPPGTPAGRGVEEALWRRWLHRWVLGWR